MSPEPSGTTTSMIAPEFDQRLDAAIEGLDVHPAEASIPGEMSIRDLRRSRYQGDDDRIGMLTLIEVNGMLQWEEGTGIASSVAVIPGRRYRYGAGTAPAGKIVKQLKFKKLEPNKIGEFLITLDDKFAPKGGDGDKPVYGLRKWNETETLGVGKLRSIERPDDKEPLLLIIHGTFINNDSIFSDISASDVGREFLHKAVKKYKGGILAFDHQTLSVSPVLNALDLARLFLMRRAPVDLLCHSRGGLVARWWLEGFNGAKGASTRAILVGSPLNGTGLAAPPRLRAALSLMTNMGYILEPIAGAAATVVPMLSVAVGILKVVTSITSLGAKAPLFDAAIAMIPGLAAQSAVSNNGELRRLRTVGSSDPPNYYAVCSNFEPSDPGWRFWKRFRNIPERAKDLAVDWVFDGPNDLAVDTASMTTLYGFSEQDPNFCRIAGDRICDFGTSDTVHHSNYFRQEETIRRIGRWLEVS